MTEAYRQGFLAKCAERGVDGHRLLEKRAQYDPYGISTGSYGMDPTDNWQTFNPTPSSQSTFTSPSLSHPVDPVKSEEAARNMDSKAIGDLYARGPAIMLASIPGAGLGLAGASGLIGAGETAGSLLEGKGLNEATEEGAKAGLLTYGGGKALEAIGRHVVAPAFRASVKYLKKELPWLRRIALKTNARDPEHTKTLTRILNQRKTAPEPMGDAPNIYLTHGEPFAVDSVNGGARPILESGEFYMPSMAMSTEDGLGFYGSGFSTARASENVPIKFFMKDSVLGKPRTIAFDTATVHTHDLQSLKKELAGKIGDSSARSHAYSKFFDDPLTISRKGYYDLGLPEPKAVSVSSAKDIVSKPYSVYSKAKRPVLEVKSFNDVPVSDVGAASIGIRSPEDMSSKSVRLAEKMLGDRGIPYYFVHDFPGMRGHMFSERPVDIHDGMPKFVMDPREMAKRFAPRIKPD